MAQIGIITEQNDLGLGFDPLNTKDQKAYSEAVKAQQEQQSKDNEKNSNK